MEAAIKDLNIAIEAEIGKISKLALASQIRKFLVPIRCEQREWDYGLPGQTYPCWIFAEHPESNTAFAYCADGFGPSYPWGLILLEGKHLSIGMDCGWFISLEEAFRSSMAWDGENPDGYEVR